MWYISFIHSRTAHKRELSHRSSSTQSLETPPTLETPLTLENCTNGTVSLTNGQKDEEEIEEKVETEEVNEPGSEQETVDKEIKGSNQKMRRSSSYVLSIIPGRRSSISLQFVKTSRMSREVSSAIEEEEEEEMSREEREPGDEEELIVVENTRRTKRNWIVNKVISLRRGLRSSLKDLKMYIK